MKMAVFWVVAPCSLGEVYRCFREACVGEFLPDYTALQPRRQQSASTCVVGRVNGSMWAFVSGFKMDDYMDE
jgi:hypothetical protein